MKLLIFWEFLSGLTISLFGHFLPSGCAHPINPPFNVQLKILLVLYELLESSPKALYLIRKPSGIIQDLSIFLNYPPLHVKAPLVQCIEIEVGKHSITVLASRGCDASLLVLGRIKKAPGNDVFRSLGNLTAVKAVFPCSEFKVGGNP